MPPNKLFLMQNQRNARKTSKLEMEWLYYMNTKVGGRIQNAFNCEDGQKTFGRLSVDGFDKETKTAYEFLGCIVHGHGVDGSETCPLLPNCLPSHTSPFKKQYGDCLQEFVDKKKKLEDMGIKVVYIWECQYAQQKDEDEDLRACLDVYYGRSGNVAGRPPCQRPSERLALRTGRLVHIRFNCRVSQKELSV